MRDTAFHGVSTMALTLGMTENIRTPELAKPKPTTSVGKDIALKYEMIGNTVHNSLRQIGLSTTYAVFTIRKMLNALGPMTLAMSGIERGVQVPNPDSDQAYTDLTVADMVRDSHPLFQHVTQDGESITFSFSTKTRLRAVIDPRSTTFISAFKKLIPNYDPPTGYAKQNYGDNGRMTFGAEDTQFDARITYDDLVAAAQASTLESPSALYCGKAKLPKGCSVEVSLRGDLTDNTLMQASTTTYQQLPPGTGSLPSNFYATMPMDVAIHVTVPLAYAMWATYSETDDEFVPTLAMNHFSTMISTAMGFTRSKSKPKGAALENDAATNKAQQAKLAKISARVGNVVSAKRRNESRSKVLGFTATVRTNADGFAILPNGSVWHIPTTDNVKEYVKLSKESATTDQNAPQFHFPSRVLYVDAVNEVLVYTTTGSTIASLKLRGCKPLDDISSAKYGTRWALSSAATKLLPIMNGALDMPAPASFIQQLIRVASDKGAYGTLGEFFAYLWQPLDDDVDAYHPLPNTFLNSDWTKMIYLRDARGDYMIPDAEDRDRLYKVITVDSTDSDADEKNLAEREVIALLNAAAFSFTKEALKFEISGGFDTALPEGDHGLDVRNTCKLALYAITHIMPRNQDLQANLLKAQRTNMVKPLDRINLRDKPIAIPNFYVDENTFVFPHQAEVIQNIDIPEPTKNTLIGGAVGFGKTLVMMADMLLLLSKGKIKRPLVVVPNKLEAQFISEIQAFSKGKVNGFAATFEHLKEMQSPEGLNFSYEDTIKFLRELPINTILVTNYNTLTNSFSQFPELYEALASYDTVGTSEQLVSFPFVDMFYAAGVDYVAGDESHKVKNMKSSRAQAFLAMCAKVDYVRLSSGTTVNNVVSDLVGQLQKINPLALGGSVEEFRLRFLDGDKQVTTAAQADAITDAMRDYATVIQKDSRSWSYMLPPMEEIYHRVALTELQARYYEIIFYKAMVRIKAAASKKKIDVDKVSDDTSEEAESTNSQLETIAARHFGVIDRFVNSPDSFSDFVDGSWTADEEDVRRMKLGLDLLTPDERDAIPPIIPDPKNDLVSVKAKWCYTLMYAHFNMRNKLAVVKSVKGAERFEADPDNKLITLSPYKITGTHLFDNMPADLKAMAVRYQANDFGAVEQFKNDPDVKILVADEISITEGHNLQVASRTIRQQGVWTPGAETQALGRTRRPDMKGARKRLGYDIINATLPSGRPTIDDLRTARLLAKKLSNAKVEFGYETSFQTEVGQVVSALQPITMSMTNIQSFPPAQLDEYFNALGKMNNWAYNSSKQITKQIGKDIEEETGEVVVDEAGNPIDLAKFVKLAVVPTKQAPDLVGSAKCYTPWVKGVMPINPLGFDMIPVRSTTAMFRDDEDEADDDEDEGSEDVIRNNAELEIGSHVMTEYGPGKVTRLGRRSRAASGELNDPINFWIDIPSMSSGMKDKKGRPLPKNVKLTAFRIYVPANQQGDKTLRDAIISKTPTMAPKPKAISTDQKGKAKERQAEREAERQRRNGDPVDDGTFVDYDAEAFDADAFDFEDADLDDEEPMDPTDILADIMDENGDIDTYDEDEEVEDDEDEEEDSEDAADLEGDALTINGQLAILFDDTDDDRESLDKVILNHQFKTIPDFARLEIKTKAALDTVLARLAKIKYNIPPQLMAEITNLAAGLTARGKLKQSEPHSFREVTNFMLTEQRRVPAKGPSGFQTIRMYAIVMRGKFFLAASISKHPFNVENLFKRIAAGVPGVGSIATFDNMAIRFVSNKRQAEQIAKAVIADGLVSNPDDLLESIADAAGSGLVSPKLIKPGATTPKVADVKPQVGKSDYKEGKRNPDIEDLREFKAFLKTKGATMTLLSGKALPLNQPYRVKSYNGKTFGLSNTKFQDPATFEFFFIPATSDAPVFDNDKGTMTVGKSKWLLSY